MTDFIELDDDGHIVGGTWHEGNLPRLTKDEALPLLKQLSKHHHQEAIRYRAMAQLVEKHGVWRIQVAHRRIQMWNQAHNHLNWAEEYLAGEPSGTLAKQLAEEVGVNVLKSVLGKAKKAVNALDMEIALAWGLEYPK